METVFDVIQSLQLSFGQVIAVGVLVFICGYLAASHKVRKLNHEKHGLEKAVMALNEELLYGTPSASRERETESSTPVIGLTAKSFKNPPIAK